MTIPPESPILVLPPKPSRFRRFTYPLWFFWMNSIRWPLIGLYIDFRKAIGPRCEVCGKGYWRTCAACEIDEFVRQQKLAELRGEDSGTYLTRDQIAELAAQNKNFRTDTPEGETPICAYCGAETRMRAFTDTVTGKSWPACCSKDACLDRWESLR